MAININATGTGSPSGKRASLVQKQTEVTATAANAATANFQQNFNAQKLKQNQEELVRGVLDYQLCGLTAATIISTFSTQFSAPWLAKYAPRIASLTALISSNPNLNGQGNLSSELIAEQNRAVDLAMAQGLVSAASIISTCNAS